MVRLFRGARLRGNRGFPVMPGHPRPPRPFESGNGFHRGGIMRGLPPRPGLRPNLPPYSLPYPTHPPRMFPPPLPNRDFAIPPPPHQPLISRDGSLPIPPHPHGMPPHGVPPPMPPHGVPPPMPPHGLPPPMPPLIPGPPFHRPITSNAILIRSRGRGRGSMHRGVKRLGSAPNSQQKKTQKRKQISEEMEVNKPWVTDALKAAIHKKHELFKIAKESKSDDDWATYKKQKILVGEIKVTAKLEYIGSHPDADVEQIMYGGHKMR